MYLNYDQIPLDGGLQDVEEFSAINQGDTSDMGEGQQFVSDTSSDVESTGAWSGIETDEEPGEVTAPGTVEEIIPARSEFGFGDMADIALGDHEALSIEAPVTPSSQAQVIEHALERLPEDDAAAQELRDKAQLVARLAMLEGSSKLSPTSLEALSSKVDITGKPLEDVEFEDRNELELAQDARHLLNDYSKSHQLGLDKLPREGNGGEIVSVFTAAERALIHAALAAQVTHATPIHAEDLIERVDEDKKVLPVDDQAEKYFTDEARILLKQAFPEGFAEHVAASVEADATATRESAAMGAVASAAVVQR